MKNKMVTKNNSIFTFLVLLPMINMAACKFPKVINDRVVCFDSHISWSTVDNSISVKIDSINGIWHYLTYTKSGVMPYQLRSFLKGDYLECDNWVDDTHWSISCKGLDIEIYDGKIQKKVELKKEMNR